MSENKRGPFYQRLLVHRSFQFKYTLMVNVITTGLTLIFGYLYYYNELAKTQILSLQNDNIYSLLQSQDAAILRYIIGFLILQFVMILFLGVYFTHKIAGPIKRVQNYLTDLKETGIPKELEGVRGRDEFQNFFQVIKELGEMLKERYDHNQALSQKLQIEIQNSNLSDVEKNKLKDSLRKII